MIVSNPPYIDKQNPHLAQGDVRFEPLSALMASDRGLAGIVHIIDQSQRVLAPDGYLLPEHGWQQGEAIHDAFTRVGYLAAETYRDYGGNE